MASPVKDAKNKIQDKWPGAIVDGRGKNWIRHQHPANPNRYSFSVITGGLGYHFGGEPYTEDSEVDTAWVVSTGEWDWEVTKNDFHCYVRDSVPVSYRYIDVATDHYVELTVTAVRWVNDEDDSENAVSFSQVTPTIDNDKITWDNITTGWNVSIQAQIGKLCKFLKIDSLSDLGVPTIGGTNIRLRLEFTWQKSNGLEVWVGDEQWSEANNTWAETSGNIEFRDEITQEPIFWFKHPNARDGVSSDTTDQIALIQRVRRLGVVFYSEVDCPWSWLQSATFPIVIDPTVDVDVGASADDAIEYGDTTSITATTWNIDNDEEWGGFRWSSVTIPDGVTIDTAEFDFFIYNDGVDEPDHTIWFEDGASPSAFTAGGPDPISNDISGRTPTTNTATLSNADLGVGAGGNWLSEVQTLPYPELKTIIQELEDSYDYSSGSSMVLIIQGSSDIARDLGVSFYDDGYAANLVIDYSTGDLSVSESDGATVGESVDVDAILAGVNIAMDNADYQDSGIKIT